MTTRICFIGNQPIMQEIYHQMIGWSIPVVTTPPAETIVIDKRFLADSLNIEATYLITQADGSFEMPVDTAVHFHMVFQIEAKPESTARFPFEVKVLKNAFGHRSEAFGATDMYTISKLLMAFAWPHIPPVQNGVPS